MKRLALCRIKSRERFRAPGWQVWSELRYGREQSQLCPAGVPWRFLPV